MERFILLFSVMFILSGCATSQATLMQRQQVIDHHPEWSADKKQGVMNGSVYLGMTKDEVTAAWGYSGNCNKTVGVWGVSEQCSMGDGKYFYYENGVLTSFQNMNS